MGVSLARFWGVSARVQAVPAMQVIKWLGDKEVAVVLCRIPLVQAEQSLVGGCASPSFAAGLSGGGSKCVSQADWVRQYGGWVGARLLAAFRAHDQPPSRRRRRRRRALVLGRNHTTQPTHTIHAQTRPATPRLGWVVGLNVIEQHACPSPVLHHHQIIVIPPLKAALLLVCPFLHPS